MGTNEYSSFEEQSINETKEEKTIVSDEDRIAEYLEKYRN